jgi:hypothetical protein
VPRYFFHVASADEFVPDYEGIILDDLKSAHVHANRLVAHMLALLPYEVSRLWSVEIADEDQLVLLTVLPIERRPFGKRRSPPLARDQRRSREPQRHRSPEAISTLPSPH